MFHAKIGGYSCTKTSRIRGIGPNGTCLDYEKGTPQQSKDNEAYYQDMDYKEGED
jgi:hypothetical protein